MEARFMALREDLKVSYQQGDLLLNCVSEMGDGVGGWGVLLKRDFLCAVAMTTKNASNAGHKYIC